MKPTNQPYTVCYVVQVSLKHHASCAKIDVFIFLISKDSQNKKNINTNNTIIPAGGCCVNNIPRREALRQKGPWRRAGTFSWY